MLKIGTYVSYRSEGVCIISDVRTEAFGTLGGSGEYYILTPIKDKNSLLYVPVSNEALVAMLRPLLSAAEIAALAAEVREERLPWRAESRARNYEFKELLGVGERRTLMVLVNTILAQSTQLKSVGKKLTGGDEAVLKRALKMLLDEFSVTSEINSEDELIEILQGSRAVIAK